VPFGDQLDDRLRARDDFRGLPPSLPFARDEAAFLFDLTDPRHAGQKLTKSIRWIGHFGIQLPPDVPNSFFSLACSDRSTQWEQFSFRRKFTGGL